MLLALAFLLALPAAAPLHRWCAGKISDATRVAAIAQYNAGISASANVAAERHYRDALALDPRFKEAAINLGVLCMERGALGAAERLFADALRLAMPSHCTGAGAGADADAVASTALRASALNNLANVALLRAQSSSLRKNVGVAAAAAFDRAIATATALFLRAHRVSPSTRVDALYNAGIALHEQRMHDAARAVFLRVLERAPRHRAVQDVNLGKVAIDVVAHDALGVRLQRRARGDRCDDGAVRARCALAVWLADRGEPRAALRAADRAAACAPRDLDALHHVFRLRGELLMWDGAEARAARLVALLDEALGASSSSSPQSWRPLTFDVFSLTLLELEPQWVRRVATALTRTWRRLEPLRRPSPLTPPPLAPFPPPPALRVALSSFNFRDHATASNVRAFLAQHNRSRLDLRCHSHGPNDRSARRRTIERLCGAGFVDTWKLEEAARARRIASDEIDILVDLVVHSHGASHGVAARRPASLVVAAQGYPGTSGASYVDYAIVDRVVVPAERRFSGGWSEKLVHLPTTYQMNSQRWAATSTAPSASVSAPGSRSCSRALLHPRRAAPDAAILCNFNSVRKIEPIAFALWMATLRRTPGAVLWLLRPRDAAGVRRTAPAADGGGVRRLQREAAARGVHPARLIFAPVLTSEAHERRVAACDLFIDTLAYGAHTTAAEVLWRGVPLLTRPALSFASRVSASLLAHVDAEAAALLTTRSSSQYEDVAVRLARGAAALLRPLRARIVAAAPTARAFDSELHARSVERAFRAMWELHKATRSPHHVVVVG